MSASFTVEQQQFRDVIRSFFAAKSPESVVRETMASEHGYDPQLWAALADQLGVQGLSIPEEYGGSGFSFNETALVLEEAGRSLVCAPLLASAIATTTLLNSDDELAKERWLPTIASGDTIATVAWVEDDGRWDAPTVNVTATRGRGGWNLQGCKSFVLDGEIASVILVVAKGDDGVGLFAVEGGDSRLTRSAMTTLDPTRRLARIEMDGVPAYRVGAPGPGEKIVSDVARIAVVALACEQVGVAGRVLDMAVEYACQRVQFGRPIGSFQAIKHLCADMMAGVEAARAAAVAAARGVSERSERLDELAAIAGSVCSETCLNAARDNIQIHGAIAVTWEYPAHLYFKRAISDDLLFGDPAYHRESLAHVIGL
ncbi:acyl-CoA dehydrogenase [Mycobacterium sp. EPa45]|nr:acyl-CoA dehydrogenase [Mycobacterium sp. EPa45]